MQIDLKIKSPVVKTAGLVKMLQTIWLNRETSSTTTRASSIWVIKCKTS